VAHGEAERTAWLESALATIRSQLGNKSAAGTQACVAKRDKLKTPSQGQQKFSDLIDVMEFNQCQALDQKQHQKPTVARVSCLV